MEFTPQRIIWHHSAINQDKHQFDQINQYHKERGFPVSSLGFYVGYHWLIENDGSIRQARKETEIGAHDAGENINSIGICLAGHFNLGYPSEEQTAAAAKLIGEIRSRWKIPVTRIEPHRWDDTTECPGTLLPDNWIINEYLKREGSVFLLFFYKVGAYFNLL